MKSTRVVKCLAMMGLISCAAMAAQAAMDDAPAYRWLFDAASSANQGTGGDVKMVIDANSSTAKLCTDADAVLKYAAFKKSSDKTKTSAGTSAGLSLSDATAITVSFFLRNPVHDTDSTFLLELGENYNKGQGRFYIGHSVENDNDKISACICDTIDTRYSNVDAKGLQLRDGKWHHIAVVYRTGCEYPTQAAIYVDGTKVILSERRNQSTAQDIPTTGLTFPAADKLYVCGRAGVAARTMDLADISIFKRELSADEVYGLSERSTSGILLVDQADGAAGTSSPVIGGHEGYQEGGVVPFSWTADGGAVEANRAWVLSTNGVTVKRGFGNCGSFVHDGGLMRLTWTTAADCPVSDYHWMLDASPSPNMGTPDVKMTFGAGVDVSNGYAAFTGQADSYAVTSDDIDLRDASAITLAFSLCNPVQRSGSNGILIEQSPAYSETGRGGCFMITCVNGDDNVSRNLALCLRIGNNKGYACVDAKNVRLADGQWHDLVVIYRKTAYPGCISLYLDGSEVALTRRASGQATEVASSPTGDFKFAQQKLYLGGRNGTGEVAANLKDFAVYKRELSLAEIQGGQATLLTTAKGRKVTGEYLPIASFDSTCVAVQGEVYSFAFGNTPLYSVGGDKRMYFRSWALYRKVSGEWTPWLSGGAKLFEFVHPGGDVKLELEFGSGLAILFR